MKKRLNFKFKLLFLAGLLAPCQILAYKIIPLFLIPYIIFIIYKILTDRKIIIRTYGMCILVLTLISGVMMYAGSLPVGWKESSIHQIVLYIVILTILFIKVDYSELVMVIKGISAGLLINIIWGMLQFILYSINKIDINDILFNQFLSLREDASIFFVSLNQICISGVNWHPSQLVPIIVLAYVIFDNAIIKLLLVILAFISTNSTCIVAIMLCLAYDLKIHYFNSFPQKSFGLIKKRKFVFFAGIILLAICLSGFSRNIYTYFANQIGRLATRLINTYKNISIDNSTMLHARYYRAYPLIIGRYGLKNALFGIGFECSGYPFSMMFGQYVSLKSWHVESDLMNFLIGRGILWTILHYTLLFYIVFKGKKITWKYSMLMLILIACGILYNNQFLWVEFLIYILFMAITHGVNILDVALDKKG